ncbi:MAG: cation transporting ATPase C-terminal domain-containing protein [Clostridia bacterium]|nr:cation transporting ATPase C-terminal domain-containing protein [Clostridia bacterium]
MITDGLYICALSLIFFTSPVIRGAFRAAAGDIYFYTGYFTFFIFISVFNAFNARCDGIDLLENLALNKQFLTVMLGIAFVQIVMTYFGGNMLRTAGLTISEWVVTIILALTIFPVDIVRKILMAKRSA